MSACAIEVQSFVWRSVQSERAFNRKLSGHSAQRSLHGVSLQCGCCADVLGAHRPGCRAVLAAGAALGLSQLLPFGVEAASGNYDAMLFACIDPRFPKLTLDHMNSRALVGKYSQFNIAGAAIGGSSSLRGDNGIH